MTRIDATKARAQFAELTNAVAYGKDRVVVERRGKGIVAIVSMADLARLEALEDAEDLRAARKALREPGKLSEREVRNKLRL